MRDVVDAVFGSCLGSGRVGDQRVADLSILAVDEDGGGSGLIHKPRGRELNHSLNLCIQKYAVELVRTTFNYFGPTLVWRF